MKKATVLLLGLFLFAGCDTVIDKPTIETAVNKAEKLQTMTDELQGLVAYMGQAYADANIVSADNLEKIKAIQAATDKVQAEFAKVLSAIKTSTYDPNDDNVETSLNLVMTAAGAISTKYSGAIIATVSLILLLYRLFKKSKAFTEVVMGNEVAKAKLPPESRAIFKDAQTLMQSESTTKMVKSETA